MKLIQTVLLWLLLNIVLVVAMQFALFTQTTPEMENASMMVKLVSSEFWASVQWMFVVPAQRLGILFLNPAQLAMSSYVFNFLSQLWANAFWLNVYFCSICLSLKGSSTSESDSIYR